MKTTHTLESAIAMTHEQSATHYDEIVAVQDMSFESLKKAILQVRQNEIFIRKIAVSYLK